MIDKHKIAIMALYQPTQLVISLIDEICKELDKRGYGYGDKFTMPEGFRIGKPALTMLSMEREDSHCHLLIHWKPDFKISTKRDPFCSAFILRPNTLKKILKHIRKN